MTYYQRCKKYDEDGFGTDYYEGAWDAWAEGAYVQGRTRELACKRLWETLVELGIAKESEVT